METTEKKVSPWYIRAEFGEDANTPRHFCYHSIMQYDDGNPFVASTWSGKPEHESERIAKLIAAAPELLKSLEAIVAAGQLALHAGDNAKHSFTEMAIMNALDAIKKATL